MSPAVPIISFVLGLILTTILKPDLPRDLPGVGGTGQFVNGKTGSADGGDAANQSATAYGAGGHGGGGGAPGDGGGNGADGVVIVTRVA